MFYFYARVSLSCSFSFSPELCHPVDHSYCRKPFSLYLICNQSNWKTLFLFMSTAVLQILNYVNSIWLKFYSGFMNHCIFYFRCEFWYMYVILWFIYYIFWVLPNLFYNAVFWTIQVRHVRMRRVENTGSLHLVSELWF